MRDCIPSVLVGLVGVMTLSAAWVVAAGSSDASGADEFQRLMGGLGIGPAAELTDCESGFDVRLSDVCTHDVDVLAGAGVLCPSPVCRVVSREGASRL